MARVSKSELQKAKLILDKMVASSTRETTLLSALFQGCYKKYWAKTKWGQEAKRYFETDILPGLTNRPINTISPKLIRGWHLKFSDRPYAGNRALRVLSKMFSYAEEEELIPLGTNPCQIIKPFKEVKRHRHATKEELEQIVSAIKDEYEARKTEATFLFLLALTGCRPSVLERALKSDLRELTFSGKRFGILEFDGKSTKKTGEKEQTIIPPRGMELLDQISGHRNKLLGIKMPKYLWARVIKKAGCSDLWARDFRRTFASIGRSTGESMDVIGGLLNHKTSQTTMVYAKLFDDSRLEAAARISEESERIFPLTGIQLKQPSTSPHRPAEDTPTVSHTV